MLSKTQQKLIDSIGDYRAILDYVKDQIDTNAVMHNSQYFCFLQDEERGEDYQNCIHGFSGCVINVTSVDFFDRNGYLEDTYYNDDERGPVLVLPNFLAESMESTYESEYDWPTTRQKC